MRKKIYYVPGLISLAFLPALFFMFTEKINQRFALGVIEVIWWNSTSREGQFAFHLERDIPASYSYLSIELTGDPETDKTKLDFSHVMIREIAARKDTTRGIHYTFGEKAKYSSLVRVLNILLIEHIEQYALYKNEAWVMFRKTKEEKEEEKTMQQLTCGTGYYTQTFIEQANWQTSLISIWKLTWPLLISFAVLLLFSIRHILRFKMAFRLLAFRL